MDVKRERREKTEAALKIERQKIKKKKKKKSVLFEFAHTHLVLFHTLPTNFERAFSLSLLRGSTKVTTDFVSERQKFVLADGIHRVVADEERRCWAQKRILNWHDIIYPMADIIQGISSDSPSSSSSKRWHNTRTHITRKTHTLTTLGIALDTFSALPRVQCGFEKFSVKMWFASAWWWWCGAGGGGYYELVGTSESTRARLYRPARQRYLARSHHQSLGFSQSPPRRYVSRGYILTPYQHTRNLQSYIQSI